MSEVKDWNTGHRRRDDEIGLHDLVFHIPAGKNGERLVDDVNERADILPFLEGSGNIHCYDRVTGEKVFRRFHGKI